MAKQVMDAGGLVGDEIMVGIVHERLAQHDARTRGYILDGFPRTVGQAQALDEITDERPIDVVIDLDVPRELVLQRLSSRRVCRDCGTNYVASGRRASACGSAMSAVATSSTATTTRPRRSTIASTSTRSRPLR